MKQQLTKEQSQRLIELGVPVEKASVNIVEETHGESHSWTYPIFTIGDLLEMLPKCIDGYSFEISYPLLLKEWSVGYTVYGVCLLGTLSNELIDALFDLVVLCAKHRIELQKMKIK